MYTKSSHESTTSQGRYVAASTSSSGYQASPSSQGGYAAYAGTSSTSTRPYQGSNSSHGGYAGTGSTSTRPYQGSTSSHGGYAGTVSTSTRGHQGLTSSQAGGYGQPRDTRPPSSSSRTVTDYVTDPTAYAPHNDQYGRPRGFRGSGVQPASDAINSFNASFHSSRSQHRS